MIIIKISHNYRKKNLLKGRGMVYCQDLVNDSSYYQNMVNASHLRSNILSLRKEELWHPCVKFVQLYPFSLDTFFTKYKHKPGNSEDNSID